jgi:hypothetical protein
MREAIGGALLIKLVMFFIVIYVCFLAIAINYSITFRVKNQIINIIESYEGYDLAKEHVDAYISNVGYYRSVGNLTVGDGTCENGYCIESIPVNREGNQIGTYYKVTTYVSFDFPIVGQISNFPVSGETRVIYGV